MSHAAKQLTKIGVFYDGNYFDLVSKYYMHQHPKKAWLSIHGLHEYIRHRVALVETVDARDCQVIDAHYFRGRFSARKSADKGHDILFNERVLDDILMRENVTAHYFPMSFAGKEKGIDVWLALEAFELSIYKQFNVVVLIAGDSDYIPLARKLKTLGIRVMVVCWSYSFETTTREQKGANPSQMLLNEVSYPLMMSEVIDRMDDARGDERAVLSGLFQIRRDRPPSSGAAEDVWKMGVIASLKDHFGFIKPASGSNTSIYFRYAVLTDADPDGLEEGMEVSYQANETPRGLQAVKVRTG
ncbi:NYN domain-containing protein [Caballeronia sp. TF1N1]|uniref:NYN domain-containing protein n=1 Tax=Caballeronia sp. TF1N1 TaxID=2878153 RepID=UPI001FD454A6|nr:NYN domain-containing protein [Caballeronia sp. TF1N1]